jgi:hypothetical protein
MSEPLQSGHHPDADQLSAFVERTLPPHEQQQTLAHLAICPDCRSIVSLSLPAVDETPKMQPEPAARRWFFGWNLVWPAAAALAGLALFILHVHNVAVTHSNIAEPTRIAISHPPEPLPAPAARTTAASPTISSFSSAAESRRSRSSAGHGSNRQKTEAVVNGENIGALSIQSRGLAELKQRQSASPNLATKSMLHGSVGDNAAGLEAGSRAPLAKNIAGNTLDRLQQSASGAASVDPGSQPGPPPPAAPPTMTFPQATTPDRPPPSVTAGTAPVHAANQTVEVAAAAASVATLSSMDDRPANQAATILTQHPLPSGLPALSVVSTAFQTLAIDTQNALFFSDDSGKHWKAIPSQWQGRAVKVDLASAASSNRRPAKLAAFGGPILSQLKVTSSGISGTVTDPTGAIIPDASIAISDATTENIRIAKTDRAGRYLFDDLVPGNYRVEAQATGFTAQQLPVTVAVSQLSTANLVLPVGQSAETVTVEASPQSPAAPSFAKKQAAEPQPVAGRLLPLFEITTDTGDRWTSVDGQTWKRK